MIPADMPHGAKVLLMVYGYMHDLIQEGMLEGNLPISEKGVAIYRELEASGFKITDAEAEAATQLIMSGKINQLALLGKLENDPSAWPESIG